MEKTESKMDEKLMELAEEHPVAFMAVPTVVGTAIGVVAQILWDKHRARSIAKELAKLGVKS